MSSPPSARGATTEVGRSGVVRLAVRDLRICLQDRPSDDVVDDVSFEVGAGEVMGLVGESGSGKTTVALALLGYARRGLHIVSGDIRLDGEAVLSLQGRDLRALRGNRVAYVPQDPASALNPAVQIGAQVREAMLVHPKAVENIDQRVRELMEEVRLPLRFVDGRHYPHQLSGGEQQRVALAMAFACRPSLIVLDEPTTGLDVSTQRHVLETVRNLCSAYQVAGVYVSHDLAVVRGLASMVAVMYAGRIIEIGPTAALFGSPAHPYTQGLLAAIPSAERAEVLKGINGQAPGPGARPTGCFFAPRCGWRVERCDEPPPTVIVGSRRVLCWRARESESAEPVHVGLPEVRLQDGGLLDVRHVTASHGQTEVLHDVSLTVPGGTCVGVVGESGSGKTTLARCIVGLHTTFNGSLEFKGADLKPGARARSKESLRRIQYIFQNPYTSLNPRKSVGQILAEPLKDFTDFARSERDDRVAAVLEDASLPTRYASRYPDQLSGGERQRVAIARALIVEPDLLICDEVTSALDVSVQAAIVELLRRLQIEHGLSMIFITHNLALVRSIAQSVAVLSQGTLVESGLVADVLEKPKHAYTAQLMEDIPKLDAAEAVVRAPARPTMGSAGVAS